MAARERVTHFETIMEEVAPVWDPAVRARLIEGFRLVERAHDKRCAGGPRRSFPYHRGVLRMLLAREGRDPEEMPWGKLKSKWKQQEFEDEWRVLCEHEPDLAAPRPAACEKVMDVYTDEDATRIKPAFFEIYVHADEIWEDFRDNYVVGRAVSQRDRSAATDEQLKQRGITWRQYCLENLMFNW